jgi:hypothetical protein
MDWTTEPLGNAEESRPGFYRGQTRLAHYGGGRSHSGGIGRQISSTQQTQVTAAGAYEYTVAGRSGNPFLK